MSLLRSAMLRFNQIKCDIPSHPLFSNQQQLPIHIVITADVKPTIHPTLKVGIHTSYQTPNCRHGLAKTFSFVCVHTSCCGTRLSTRQNSRSSPLLIATLSLFPSSPNSRCITVSANTTTSATTSTNTTKDHQLETTVFLQVHQTQFGSGAFKGRVTKHPRLWPCNGQ